MTDQVKGVKEMWAYKVALAKYIGFLTENKIYRVRQTLDNHLTEIKLDTLRDCFHTK